MITEDYVSFEVAKLLKEKGFDEALYSYYKDGMFTITDLLCKYEFDVDLCRWGDNEYAAPTLQMAMKWLREVHKIFIEVGYNRFYGTYNVHVFNMVEQQDDPYKLPARFNNYEEACESAIKYCLEHLI